MDLQERIRRLEDIEALKQLKYRYCLACDDDYDAERLAPLFTEDAVWDGGAMGRYEERGSLRRSLSAPSGPVALRGGDRRPAQGHRYGQEWVHVLRLRDGRIEHLREYNDTAAMLAAFEPARS